MPAPMVTGAAFSSYVLATNGDWEFAQMASMTGAQFLASQSIWTAAPADQYLQSGSAITDETLMSIVNGTGLVLYAGTVNGSGITTGGPGNGSSNYGAFNVTVPFYREICVTIINDGTQNRNWPASWSLGTYNFPQNAGGSAEIDLLEVNANGYGGAAGQVYSNLHSPNSQQNGITPADYGVLGSTSGVTYRIGVYVTETQLTFYWDGGNNGTPRLSPAANGNPTGWPGENPPTGLTHFLLHVNGPGSGYGGPTDTAIPYIVVYDRIYVPGSGGTPPSFTAESPGGGTTGTAYTYTFVATGSPAPTFAVSSGTLPAGLSLNSTTGVLSGTPTTAATYTFVVTASSSAGSTSSPSLSVTISALGVPVFSADSPGGATLNSSYSYTFAASNSPTFAVSSGNLPIGMTLVGSTGVLSGTPTVSGTFSFVIAATNSLGTTLTPTITIVVSGGSGSTSIVQSGAYAGATSGQSTTAAFDGIAISDIAAGDSCVINVISYGASALTSLTTNFGVFTRVNTTSAIEVGYMEQWFCGNCTGGGNEVTAATSGGVEWSYEIIEFAGATSATAVVTSSLSGVTSIPAAFTPTASGQYAVAFASLSNDFSGGPASPWVNFNDTSESYWNITSYQSVSTRVSTNTSTITATWTAPSASYAGVLGLLIKPTGPSEVVSATAQGVFKLYGAASGTSTVNVTAQGVFKLLGAASPTIPVTPAVSTPQPITTAFGIVPVAYNGLSLQWDLPTGVWNQQILLRSAFGTPLSIYSGDGAQLLNQTGGLTSLTAPINVGTAYSQISVVALAAAVPAGTTITVVDASGDQLTLTLSQNAAINATTVHVEPFISTITFAASDLIWQTSFVDTGLRSGRFYYYSLLVFSEAFNGYIMAGAVQGLVLTDFQSNLNLQSWTPDWYLTADQNLATTTQPLGPLQRFYQLLGYELDWIRSEIESIYLFTNIELVSGALLPNVGGNFGMDYEPSLGMARSRVLVENAVHLYKNKGTLTGVRDTASAYTGFSIATNGVGLSPNLEIQLDDSAFDMSTGHWIATTNPGIVALQQSAAAHRTTTVHQLWNPVPSLTAAQANDPMGYLPVTGNDNVLQITNQSGAAAAISMISLGNANAVNPLLADFSQVTTLGIPVSQAATPPIYVVSAYFQPDPDSVAPAVQHVFMAAYWYNVNGALISISTGTSVLEIAGQWVRAYVAATPPAGAAYLIRAFGTAATIAANGNEAHLVDAEQVEINTQATPGPSTWTPPRDVWINLLPSRQQLITNPTGGSASSSGWAVSGGTMQASRAMSTPPAVTWPAETTSGFQVVSTATESSGDGVGDFGGSEIGGVYIGGGGFTGTGAGMSSTNLVITRTISVTAGVSYSFSIYLQAATTSRVVQLSVAFYNALGAQVDAPVFNATTTSELFIGVNYSQLSVNAIPFAVTEGQTASLQYNGQTQVVTILNAAPANSQVLTVVPFIANATYPVGTGAVFGASEFSDVVGSFTQGSIINQLAPPGATSATITATIIGTVTGEIHYLGAPLFEPLSYLLPYFDGSFTPSSDFIWEGTPNASISDYYPNYVAKLSRLIDVMPDYLPIGATFSIFLGAQAFTNSGLVG